MSALTKKFLSYFFSNERRPPPTATTPATPALERKNQGPTFERTTLTGALETCADPLWQIFQLLTYCLTTICMFNKLVVNDENVSQLFKERLMMKEVPRGWSPLIAAIENDHPDILKYIFKHFPVNIEQEMPYIMYDNRNRSRVQVASTALWVACCRGNVTCVKVLVEEGADMNHMCNSSSPLLEAIRCGHMFISLYLLRMGANIPSSSDDLLIQVVNPMMCTEFLYDIDERCELICLLIEKGVNIHRTAGPNGNTALHFCRDPKIAKTLIDAGAKNTLNDRGLSVVVNAAVEGRNYILEKHLIRAFQCEPRELYDVHCMQAVVKEKKQSIGFSQAWSYIQKAVQVRSSHPDLFADLPPADEIYDGLQEPTTMEEYEAITQDRSTICYLCSIYCERILGRTHPQTLGAIRGCIDNTSNNFNHAKSFQFCQRYLDFGLSPTINDDGDFKHLNEVIVLVAGTMKFGHVPSIQPLFQRALEGLKHSIDINFISSMSRLVALWIKVADKCITDSTEQEREHTLIKRAVQELITSSGNNGATIIRDTLYKNGTDYKLNLPLAKVLTLLLDCECPIQCRHPETGDFPLHLAVKLEHPDAMDCVQTLLEYGAHVDAVNFENKTAKESIGHNSGRRFVALESFEVKPPTLQCLSARAIVEYNIEYREYLPINMAKFISWHSI